MAEKNKTNKYLNLFKWGNRLRKGLGLLGGSGASGLSASSVAGGAPAGFQGVATGNAFAPAAGGVSPGLMSGVPLAGALAFGGMVGSKILQGMTNDHPHLNFHGNNIKYSSGGGRGSWGDGVSYNQIQQNTPNHGGVKSKEGFDYAISSKDFKGALEASKGMRDYLDSAFKDMQSQTDVDLNKIIPYAFDGVNMKSGENPQQMADRVIKNVAKSVRKGKSYNPESKYISGSERKNYIMDEYNKRDFDRMGGQALTDSDIERMYSGNGYYNSPVYSDIPTFEGDKNFKPQGLMGTQSSQRKNKSKNIVKSTKPYQAAMEYLRTRGVM